MPAKRRHKEPMSPWLLFNNTHEQNAKINAKRYNITRPLRFLGDVGLPPAPALKGGEAGRFALG